MKRATQALWPVLVMVAVITFTIVIMLFIKKTGDVGMSEADRTACKASVIAHSKTGSDINCPIQVIDVKTSDEDEMKDAILDAMAECWDNYGQGKIDVFTSASPDSYCAVCSVLEFKDSKNLKGVPFALGSRHFSVSGKRTNYFEFFAGDYMSSENLQLYATSQSYIDTSDDLVIMFAQRPTKGDKKEFFVDPITFSYESFSVYGPDDMYSLGIPVADVSDTNKILRIDVNRLDEHMVNGITAIVLNSTYMFGICDNFPVSLVGIEDNKEVV